MRKKAAVSVLTITIAALTVMAWLVYAQFIGLQAQIKDLQAQNSELESQISNLENRIAELEDKNHQLKNRVIELMQQPEKIHFACQNHSVRMDLELEPHRQHHPCLSSESYNSK